MKVEAYLWTKKNSSNKFPIKIRITEKRKSKFISIDYAISKQFWNPKTHRVRETYENYEKVNNLIENKIKELNHLKSIKSNVFKVNNYLSFIDYFDKHIIRLNARKKFGSYKKHKVILKHLKEFIKQYYTKEDLLFDEIDRSFLEDLRTYFFENELIENTQNGYFRKIKYLYYEAIKDNHYLPVMDPFATFKNKSSKASNKSLTINEMTSIETFNSFQYDFKEKKNIVSTRKLFDAKNAFIFQFYMRGLRVSDLIFLKWGNINNRKIEYVMRKTKKHISIPLNDKLVQILRLYMPVTFKEQYFREQNYGDKEMFFSLNTNDRETITKKIKPTNYYDKFSDYSYTYEITSYDKLLNKFNHLSTNPEYSDLYIFNILKPHHIESLNNSAETDEFNRIEYNIIQTATTLYNKQLKLINGFVFDEEGQNIKTTITSHLARHTYASIGVKLGFDILTISRSLGHMDLKTTQAYINTLDTDFVDDENKRLFEKLEENITQHLKKTKYKAIGILGSDVKRISDVKKDKSNN